ncbi:MAG TPA: hypothetical protein VF158_15105 [Longimicrobiales bacterium]
MRLVFGRCDSRVEEHGLAVWRWLIETVHARWPGADVRYHAYSGLNHRHWRVLLPSGRYFVLAMTEETLEALGPAEIAARIEASGWLERAPALSSTGALLTRDGALVDWEPHAGAATL